MILSFLLLVFLIVVLNSYFEQQPAVSHFDQISEILASTSNLVTLIGSGIVHVYYMNNLFD